MSKIMALLLCTCCLAACATNGSSNSVVYGDIKAGVETTRHF